MSFKDTNIWQISLAERENDPHKIARERLRSAYDALWDNACELSRQIALDVPNLTLHDERHFNALWFRADQILGEAAPLTPVEAFVLGAAILLHDTANTVAAYPNRLADIEATAEWQDEIAERWKPEDPDEPEIPVEIRKVALFNVLRNIHGRRAESLADLVYRSPDGETVHLFPDEKLRPHLGRIIGLVSASHHWDIQELPDRLNKVLGAMAGHPTTWTLQPIRVACLLRCSDALQIDQERVPDFLYAILDLQGVSLDHWRAQNRLLAPVRDPDDPDALIVTSSRDFNPDEADAWWIAYEAISVANKELQDSHALLRDLRQQPFAISRIRDAESPMRLAAHVTVHGWQPVNAEVKVSSVANVVKMFGGVQLYGSDYLVPIRELLQNAADAIRRRREIPSELNYNGEITARIRDEGDEVFLEILDDGIGMSEAALTGPLIDFGSSYFGSQLAKIERPGLLSRTKKRSGRYGIGFFSSFMIAEQVEVISRPFDQGISEARALSFRNGFSLRPLLLKPNEALSPLTSTIVRLRVSRKGMSRLLTVRPRYGFNRQITFREAVGLCAPMVDCDIYYEHGGRERELIHSAAWYDEDRATWLKRVLLLTDPEEDEEEEIRIAAVARTMPNLRFVDATQPDRGLAAIAPYWSQAGLPSIGGFRATANRNDALFESEFIGCIEFPASGPRRAQAYLHRYDEFAAWADEQAHILAEQDLPDEEVNHAVSNLMRFGGSPIPLARIYLDRRRSTIHDLVEALQEGAVYAPLNPEYDEPHWQINKIYIGPDEVQYTPKKDEIELSVKVVEASAPEQYGYGPFYHVAQPGDDLDPLSLEGCVDKLLREVGKRLEVEYCLNQLVGIYTGPASERDEVFTGSEVKIRCLKLEAVAIG